jgi:topoisomerase-4 subunit A
VFDLDEIPQMAKGQGVKLQAYKEKDARVEDIKLFRAADGLTFKRGEQTRSEPDLTPWKAKRATAGKLPPTGFPRNNKFGD